ncbi:DUF2207 domain-containing protein [Streptomyces sp. NBC_00820]|uniref:DUF2207 family protein n=1 Tax=Streptomyces sp. NBC_00820 TaxID=2975842 RepID=UPI002ED2D39A|nr:DUF2207 domain-containing protein [Streptomyces sp. NBC_00820]
MSDGTRGGRPGRRTSVRRRRIRGLIGILAALLVLAASVGVARLLGNEERVTRMWVGAEIAEDGSARITEVIDYDFGYRDTPRHGIYRDLPDLPYDHEEAKVRATEDGAVVPWELDYGDHYRRQDGGDEIATRIKVGDPGGGVEGLHRYRVQYTLQDVVKNGKLAWDAVGTGWRVDRADVEIHVVAPYGLTGTRCVHGGWNATDRCRVERTGPGALSVRLAVLKGKEGVTLYATGGKKGTGAADRLPAPPTGKAVGTTVERPLKAVLLAVGAALAAAVIACGLLRVAGRDRYAPEGPDGTPGRARRVGHRGLISALTPSAALPEGLTPAQGGVLLAERVEPEHRIAWLLGAAVDGHITLSGSTQAPTIRRGTGIATADPDTRDILRRMLGGLDELTLGRYDPGFLAAWEAIGSHLERWQGSSGNWDESAARRVTVVRRVGTALAGAGFVTAVVGAVLGGGRNPAGDPALLAGAIALGAGLAAALFGMELHSRTPAGTRLWLRVEALRRYLADPAALPDSGHLDDRQVERYTAWAVALGLGSSWQRALEDSAVTTTRRTSTVRTLEPSLALGLHSACARTHTRPASSSSGSSGGSSFNSGSSGSVGGGSGGGGGGSW